MAVCLATRNIIQRLAAGWLGAPRRRGSFRLTGGFGRAGKGETERKKIGRDLYSLKPAPSAGVTSSPILRLNPKPPLPTPSYTHLAFLPITPTVSQRPLSSPPPPPPLLAFFTSPHPASCHHHPHSESHRSPCREGRQRPGSSPGPSRSPHPPRWGALVPLPRVQCPPRPLREPSSGAGRLGPRRGTRPIPGSRWPRPRAFRCALAQGRDSRVLEPPCPSCGHRDRLPTPAAVLPTLGNRTLPRISGFPKTPDLQILRMAF